MKFLGLDTSTSVDLSPLWLLTRGNKWVSISPAASRNLTPGFKRVRKPFVKYLQFFKILTFIIHLAEINILTESLFLRKYHFFLNYRTIQVKVTNLKKVNQSYYFFNCCLFLTYSPVIRFFACLHGKIIHWISPRYNVIYCFITEGIIETDKIYAKCPSFNLSDCH